MRAFVESLKRLYACNKICISDVERQLENGKINEEEYKYISGLADSSSMLFAEEEYHG